MAKKCVDARGFRIFDEFKDEYEAKIAVKESSRAFPEHVWVFVEGGRIDFNDGSAHLTVEQAKRLVKALNDWLEFVGEGPSA